MKHNIGLFILLFCFSAIFFSQTASAVPGTTVIKLSEPELNGSISLEQAIKNRRSIRQFTPEPLNIDQVAQLCWSAQGITDEEKGLRAAPSAGAIYPVQLYVALPDGLYLYNPEDHTLEKKIDRDIKPMLYTASFKQKAVQESPCIFIIAAFEKMLEAKYRGKGERFASLEAGHIAQNMLLQAVTLGLGSFPVGGFASDSVAKICKFPDRLVPLYLICVGNPIEKPSLVPAIVSMRNIASMSKQPRSIHSKRVIIILAEKRFNDADYFDVEETFQIAGISPEIASSKTGEVKGSGRNVATATKLVKDIKVDDYDAFIFIGGLGVKQFFDDRGALNLVRQANEQKKILAAIGNAPGIFARARIINGKNIACSPVERGKVTEAGADWKRTLLEVDDNIITAVGGDSARRFGSAVLTALRRQD